MKTETQNTDTGTTSRLDVLEQKSLSQQKTIDQQTKTIEALTKQLSIAGPTAKAQKAEKPKIPDQTFKVGDQEFKFVLAEFIYGEQKMTAIDALTDTDVLADLVDKKSGVIQELF